MQSVPKTTWQIPNVNKLTKPGKDALNRWKGDCFTVTKQEVGCESLSCLQRRKGTTFAASLQLLNASMQSSLHEGEEP